MLYDVSKSSASSVSSLSSYMPYGVDDLDEDDYYAVGIKSEKKSKLPKSEPDEPMVDYTCLYTNLDPTGGTRQ